MFRTSIVHLQERSYAVCCNLVCLDTLWGWRKNCSSSFTLITTGRIETYQIATYSIRTLLRMEYWSPKHVELLNVMNKINHQILCILLDYIYIVKGVFDLLLYKNILRPSWTHVLQFLFLIVLVFLYTHQLHFIVTHMSVICVTCNYVSCCWWPM